ncbi:hypothetical protein P3T76_012838 [Phytophthora citrophthora]|uniref:Uncharacterized protein n=1 Tax=Phytophthora citrophthora TaxID=4793 RepID=A0AAD9LDP7_9STRA|nr:hypothetical protein P3T76_012838 [Phytophthora citrophthora]
MKDTESPRPRACLLRRLPVPRPHEQPVEPQRLVGASSRRMERLPLSGRAHKQRAADSTRVGSIALNWDLDNFNLMMRRWGFHAVALTSGSRNEELAAKKELLNRLKADAELSSWARSCSYRVVGRAELEEIVQVTYQEELEVKRHEDKELVIEESVKPEDAEQKEEEITRVTVTPSLLALAFQSLVGKEKREFLAYQQTDTCAEESGGDTGGKNMGRLGESVQTPARVYLLVDYPCTLLEIDELLRLGEVGSTIRPEKLPLLPLIDGVVLLADPLDMAAVRARNSTNPTRKSVVKVGGNASRMSTIEASVFQGANTIVKSFYEAAQVGGLEWSDFTFTNVSCSTEGSGLKPPDVLEQELVTTVESIATQKFSFKDWVGSTKFSVISDNEGDSGVLCNAYESVLSGIYPGSVGVGTVLFAIVEAVAMVSPVPTIPVKQPRASQADPHQLEEFLEYGDLVSCRLASAQLCHELLQEEGDPCFIPHGNHRLDDIERAMWKQSDLPGVGNEGRKAMPRVPELSEQERSVRNTELATFYDSPRFSCWMIHLTQQLLEVEEMLGSSWKGKLQPRAFVENLTRAVLPQRIAWVLQQNSPDVCSRYYAATDSLLLAILPKTAPGRMQVSSWAAIDHVRHRPAFKYWKREELAPIDYLTPRTEAAARACIPLSARQLTLVGVHTWAMYPADHSVVRLYQTPRGLVWLTVYRDGETFGLRSGTANSGDGITHEEQRLKNTLQFIASFQDDSTLHISEGRRQFPKKPDKFPSVMMTNSFPTGLIVSACSDGTIAQRYALEGWDGSSKVHATNEPLNRDASGVRELNEMDKEEKYHVIYGKGSVLRVLRCGRQEVLLASGIVCVVHGCGCTRTKHHHSSKKGTSQNTELHPPTVTTLTVDPETNALVERRPSGAIVVTFTSGARVTYHIDGTRMYMNAGSSHILVKKRGFADVCIDMEVNATAQCHAAGERVAVTKGGLRVRSVVNVYDGTNVEISYNTKVTAQVNGRVTTRKPNGQVIVAKDSGRVEYRSDDQSSLDSRDDDDRNVTSHNGVYYFDYRLGQFQFCDNEQNQFHVDFSGTEEEPGPLVSVDLAGVVSDAEASRYEVDSIPAKAVINEPIQPHIFVLNGNGTGLEILRPRDITGYLEDARSEKQVGDMLEMGSSTPYRHVFLRKLSARGGDSIHQKPPFNDMKLQEEFTPTAGKYLSNYFCEIKRMVAYKQFTTVRRVEQIQPLSADELNAMHCGWAKWEQWQKDREAIKECYKVVDPRQPEVIAQELAMQKKVLAAYKATRARKKMARQKAREMKAQSVPQELSPDLRMETVQEGEGEDDGESDDDFGHFGSDLSDGDVGDAAEVDDPMELLWSAFSQADAEGRGLLSVAQTRLGLVTVLGIGVTTSELTEALVRFKIAYPFNVSFDVFADLVAFFRQVDDSPEASDTEPESFIPSLKGFPSEQRKDQGAPRGSAAEAIRARQQQYV